MRLSESDQLQNGLAVFGAMQRGQVDLIQRLLGQSQGQAAHRLDQQRLPSGEVMHQRALGHAGSLGHSARGQRAVALIDQALGGGLDQRAASGCPLLGSGDPFL